MSGRVVDFSSARKNRLTGYIEILFFGHFGDEASTAQ